jgi:hypothetical protein
VLLRIYSAQSIAIFSTEISQKAEEAMIFKQGVTKYQSTSAGGIIRQMQHEAVGFKGAHDSLYPFLLWSLTHLENQIPFRELDLNELVDEETLALSYLCLLERYGLGELLG